MLEMELQFLKAEMEKQDDWCRNAKDVLAEARAEILNTRLERDIYWDFIKRNTEEEEE